MALVLVLEWRYLLAKDEARRDAFQQIESLC
jgi:hypothetical protein